MIVLVAGGWVTVGSVRGLGSSVMVKGGGKMLLVG